jgi:anti-sigma-K factor RskA
MLTSMAFVVAVGYVLVDATKEVPQPVAQAPATEYVALLNDQKAQPVWVVSAADFKQITVKVVAPPPLDADKAYELWLLPGENQPPRSLGLLPLEGTATVAVPAELQTAMAAGKVLAVSLEPAGGSPTGLPTGPVLYTGLLVTTS